MDLQVLKAHTKNYFQPIPVYMIAPKYDWYDLYFLMCCYHYY